VFGNAGQQELFSTTGKTTPDNNGGLGKVEQFRYKINNCLIRSAINGRRGQAQLESIAMQSSQLSAGGSGLDMQRKQQATVKPGLEAW
jgi:hypothetical protein